MSRDRDIILYIDDMILSCQRLNEYTKEHTFETFTESQITIDAVLRNFEVLGESANQIPKDKKLEMKEMPFFELIAMRNKLIHGYFGVNIKTVWDTIKKDIPSLLEYLEKVRKIYV